MYKRNLFQGTIELPYHFSVGAVAVDTESKVWCHYYEEFRKDSQGTFKNFYTLMRETVEGEEPLEFAVLRGIREEFGVRGTIRHYLGSLISKFPKNETWIEKTTAYFLVELTGEDEESRVYDDDFVMGKIRKCEMDFLIEKMKDQGKRFERTDLDESHILMRAKKLLNV